MYLQTITLRHLSLPIGVEVRVRPQGSSAMLPRKILSALFSFRSRNWGNCRTAQRRDGGNTVSTRTRKRIHPNASLSSDYEVAYTAQEKRVLCAVNGWRASLEWTRNVAGN